MGGTVFLLFIELLRRLLDFLAWAALVLSPVFVFLVSWLLRRGVSGVWRVLLVASLGIPVVFAAGGVFWLRFDGALGPDHSLATLEPGIGAIHSLAVTGDGGWVLAGAGDGSVALCTFGPPEACRRFAAAEYQNVEAVDISPDGRLFAAVTILCTVTDLPIHVGRITGVDAHPAAARLASSSWDGTVKLWEPGTVVPVRSLGAGEQWVTGVALGPLRIVAGRRDGRLVSWGSSASSPDCVLDAHARGLFSPLQMVNAVAYSSQRGIAASGAMDRRVVLSDPGRCEIVARLPGHRRAVTGVELTLGGERMVTSSMDGTIKLWSVEASGLEAAAPVEHGGAGARFES